MKKLVAVVLAALLLVPMLAGPAQAWGRGGGWHGGGGGWHGHGGWGWGWGGFAAGVGIGALATAPLWYPPVYAYPYPAYPAYSYPAYPTYPAYSYPTYSYPTPPPPAYPSPADSGVAPQTGQSATVNYGSAPAPPAPVAPPAAPSGGGQNCQTVTVDGHNETRTFQNGQTATVWVPTYTQQVCQ